MQSVQLCHLLSPKFDDTYEATYKKIVQTIDCKRHVFKMHGFDVAKYCHNNKAV